MVGDQCNATRHSVSLKNIKVLTRERQWTKRNVKEAIYIKKNTPSMNRKQGYQTRIPTAPDLPSAPASWAVPVNENIRRLRLLDEKPKCRKEFQNKILSEYKFIHLKEIIIFVSHLVPSSIAGCGGSGCTLPGSAASSSAL